MNKQDLINDDYKYICQTENKMELWAKFTGYIDIISYLCYDSDNDTVLKQSRKIISMSELKVLSELKDKMEEVNI